MSRFGADDKRGFARQVLVLWLASSALLALCTVFMHWVHVPGWDMAAHLYKADLIRRGQSIVWDNFWYGGSYGAIVYGFVYYYVVRLVPASVVTVLAGGLIAPAFFIYQRLLWHIDNRRSPWLLAAVLGIYLAHGQAPFMMALALSMLGLALVALNRPLLGALPVAVGVFANPMGLLVCGMFIVADLVSRPETRRRYLLFFLPLIPAGVVRMGLAWSFAEPSSYLNQTSQVMVYLGFALAGVALAGVSVLEHKGPFVALFMIYAGACLATFAMPESALGNNIGRFFMVFGLPLLILFSPSRLRRPLPFLDLVGIPIVLFAILQLSLPFNHLTDRSDWTQTRADFFAPALAFAADHRDVNQRIHVVALRRHWEAYYFCRAGYPITRGWYRQADAIHNGLLMTSYDDEAYARWLRDMGVEYVYLAATPLDHWTEREVDMLESSDEFSVVAREGAWTVYRLTKARGLVEPPAGAWGRIVALDHRSFTVKVSAPGTYLVKMTWNPYWRVSSVGGSEQRARLSIGRDSFTQVQVPVAGEYRVDFEANLRSASREALDTLGDWPLRAW